MIKLHRALMAGALLALASASASTHAATVNGALPLASFGAVTNTTADLSGSPVVTSANTQVNGPGTVDFSGVTLGTLYGPNTVDTTNLNVFTLSNATFGSFAASQGTIVTQNADFLDVYYVGQYTGVGASPSGPASVRVSINLSGGVYSEAITLHAPPSGVVPEPASVVLAGLGLASVGLLSMRRKRSAN